MVGNGLNKKQIDADKALALKTARKEKVVFILVAFGQEKIIS